MRIICLLAVRNGANYLDRYFETVGRFCDGVIALDDGSTDNTLSLLRSHPLVLYVLSNPSRKTYAGWDDSLNRTRLLEACEPFMPNWILWLDADEEIPACDAPLVRSFLKGEASKETAYGLEVLRLIGDYEHFDQGKLWAYRLIPFKRGYKVPKDRLHFAPVPVQLPRTSWRRTRLRIAHSAGLTSHSRRARYQKYQEADPHCEWQKSYEELLMPAGHIWAIKPLPLGLGLIIPETTRSSRKARR